MRPVDEDATENNMARIACNDIQLYRIVKYLVCQHNIHLCTAVTYSYRKNKCPGIYSVILHGNNSDLGISVPFVHSVLYAFSFHVRVPSRTARL